MCGGVYLFINYDVVWVVVVVDGYVVCVLWK